jgi:hypothetical protein
MFQLTNLLMMQPLQLGFIFFTFQYLYLWPGPSLLLRSDRSGYRVCNRDHRAQRPQAGCTAGRRSHKHGVAQEEHKKVRQDKSVSEQCTGSR